MINYFYILLAILFLSFIIQKIFSLKIYSNFEQLLLSNIVFFLIGFSWDLYSTSQGHWKYAVGIFNIFGIIPIEELLFYLVVPYMILVIYKLITKGRNEITFKRQKSRNG